MKTRITLLLLSFISFSIFSQRKVADKFYKEYAYIKAAEFYRNAINRGDDGVDLLSKLADCYYNNSDSKQAVYWYKLASKREGGLVDNESIYRYAQSLRSVGDYKEAETWLKKLPESYVNTLNVNHEKLKTLHRDSVRISNMRINTKNSDFGPYVHNGKFYFASAKNENGALYEWNNEPYLDLYQGKIIEDTQEKTIEDIIPVVSTKLNTGFHESSLTITKDGKTMYFTRNNLDEKNELEHNKEGTSHLKIFKAELVNGTWSNIQELPINSELHSNGHPALSPDEKTLYFVSDRPDGFGQADIYKVAILEDGTFGTPQNLGGKVNTSGKEMFPYIAKDNTLYFSSDGHKNLGLLDIYKVSLSENATSEAENLGAPFNSGYDDFGFFMNEGNRTGYFSSNRPEGKGRDDIYSFKIVECFQYLKGKTFDKRTKELLPNTLVELIDSTGKVVKRFVTQEDATYTFEVKCKNRKFTLRGTKLDYKDDIQNTESTEERDQEILQDLYLTPLIVGKEIVINPIFFDFNKWNIRPDAAYELEFVVKVMNNHPKMIIKIEAHTDSRGSDRYNEILSDRRAKSTRDYIISRGIAPHRIQSAIGYGEKQLVNKCKNYVRCTEEEHQENRRSKFIILNNYE
ncbi:OmpA family protein [uncultured Tenacibaculum sp.]|uniref:OmpA family protein n=1 Tax=uncultured Tenacibaculum sp. TaxID=174713 RepID=UPI002616955B|nr:OmpA family protein [uncultured Tenacibaculum sp.]